MSVVGAAIEQVGSREQTIAEDGTRTYRRTWKVQTNNATDDGNVVRFAPGIPTRWISSYVTQTSVDTFAICREINCRPTESPYWWEVEATYSTRQSSAEQEDEQENPLNEPADIEFSFETIQVVAVTTPDQATRGTYGRPANALLKNAAGELFDPPPLVDKSRLVCTITRNEANYNVGVSMRFVDAVNSDVFFGAQPRTVKMRSITARRQIKNGFGYWQVTYVLAFDENNWDMKLLNYGSYFLTVAAPSTNAKGRPFSELGRPNGGLLKSDGTAFDFPPTTFTSSDLVLSFRVHKEEPFSVLNLPLGP